MSDSDLMQRAIELAMRGRGRVEPNPMVGCVLVRDGRIISEGYHQFFGGPHAEPNALAACPSPAGATAYVTLEPCCHTNKKTPPCTRAIIAAKLFRVVVACEDANPSVSGNGLRELQAAGIAVESGLLAAESMQLNAAYAKCLSQHRPYVTLKWAQTADGKIAGPGGARLAISNSASLQVIHDLRSRSDAILVGINTALSDNPLLISRSPDISRQPLRIVLDTNLRIGLDNRLVKTASQWPLLVCCAQSAMAEKSEIVSRLQEHGVNILPLRTDPDGYLSLEHLLDELGARKTTHLMVEPGPILAESFLRQNLADRVWISRSPNRADAVNAPNAAEIDFPSTGTRSLQGDELTEYLNRKSSVFFSLRPSADFLLVTRLFADDPNPQPSPGIPGEGVRE